MSESKVTIVAHFSSSLDWKPADLRVVIEADAADGRHVHVEKLIADALGCQAWVPQKVCQNDGAKLLIKIVQQLADRNLELQGSTRTGILVLKPLGSVSLDEAIE